MKNVARISTGSLLGFALVAGMASPSRAGLVLTGAIEQIAAPASDVQGSDPTSSTTAFVWAERSSLVLANNVRVDMSAPGTSDSGNAYRPSNGIVAAGTAVDTYLIHSDPLPGDTHEYIATVTFDTPILGVIDTITRLANTDASLGSPDTTYPGSSTARGLDSPDTLMWSSDGRTLSIDFSTGTYVDEVRVLVAASTVPEPATLISLATGVAMLAGLRRRRVRPS